MFIIACRGFDLIDVKSQNAILGRLPSFAMTPSVSELEPLQPQGQHYLRSHRLYPNLGCQVFTSWQA